MNATSAAGFYWLVVTPAVKRWFTQRHVPAPLRVPVRFVRRVPSGRGKGLASVQLPGALADALGLPTTFITVAQAGLRPAVSVVVWSAARSAVRRSVGAIG